MVSNLKKTRSSRQVLIENLNIRQKRIEYLNTIKQFREQKRNIVYTDETYILSSHTVSKTWTDGSIGQTTPISKGDRLIIIHAGSENGFIPNSLTMWRSSVSTGDYHNQMNWENYKKWLEEKLIPNLLSNSVLVMDNASYHCKIDEKAPTSNSRKADMISWLQKNNISYTESMLKPTLYKLIKYHKPYHTKYLVDNLMKEHGHDVLRLPPYHPDLNPIENIWNILKQWVASHNTTFKIHDIERLAQEKFNMMGATDWAPVCNHIIKNENEYLEKEICFDSEQDKYIFEFGSGSTDEDLSDTDSVDSTSETDLTGIEPLQ